MTRILGFSTGALALSDFRRALEMLRPHRLPAVELSALRDNELPPLLEALDGLDLSAYSYISFHAPSDLRALTEKDVTDLLRPLLRRRWPIIVHPNVIADDSLWQGFREWMCIENMDKRKPIGRTVTELQDIFARFPEASFCFDIGHASQVDPTMTEAALILRRFGGRLKQLHVSEVTSSSRHEGISFTAMNSFRKVAHLVPPTVPLILEPVISEEQIDVQLRLAEAALTPPQGHAAPISTPNGTAPSTDPATLAPPSRF